jgi:acyl carrier protein
LTAFTIVTKLEEKYGVKLRGIEIRRCATLVDLLNLINSK